MRSSSPAWRLDRLRVERTLRAHVEAMPPAAAVTEPARHARRAHRRAALGRTQVPTPIDEMTARRLERVAPRALKLLVSSVEGPEGARPAVECAEPGRHRGDRNADQARERPRGQKPRASRRRCRPLRTRSGSSWAAARLRVRCPPTPLMRSRPCCAARGRPALNIEGDEIEAIDEHKHPGSDFWVGFRDRHEDDVGHRRGRDWGRDGQGSDGDQGGLGARHRLADQVRLVITNRHVLFPSQSFMRLARRVPGATTDGKVQVRPRHQHRFRLR